MHCKLGYCLMGFGAHHKLCQINLGKILCLPCPKSVRFAEPTLNGWSSQELCCPCPFNCLLVSKVARNSVKYTMKMVTGGYIFLLVKAARDLQSYVWRHPLKELYFLLFIFCFYFFFLKWFKTMFFFFSFM